MSLYLSYQLVGGNEDWVPVRADTDFSTIKPTFVTVLACDTLLTKRSPPEMVDTAKYSGPLYFDLDCEDDLTSAIEGAKKLWGKLQKFGLDEHDVQIFLSGKKGLHIIVPQEVFCETPKPIARLFAIYKEWAFNLAVDTMDFAVYSGKRGRMFRTHYNQRDNGLWKVQISVNELMSLTEESYSQLASDYRPVTKARPTFRPAFAIKYEELVQHSVKTKPKKRKPLDPFTLRQQYPTVKRLMEGQGVARGFNEVALQLALYAHEAKLSCDDLLHRCAGLIAKHTGDSFRYNSPAKRKAELRRMYDYVEDNSSYSYSIGGISACLTADELASPSSDEDEFGDEGIDNSGLVVRNGHYYAQTETGDRHILDCVFKEPTILRDRFTEEISHISTKIVINGKSGTVVNCEREVFANNSNLHKLVALKGASFTGTDIHARYIYSLMLREAKRNGKSVYTTSCEGVDVLYMPLSAIEEARQPFLTWVDSTGVAIPERLKAAGLGVQFTPEPGPDPLIKTDLAAAPHWSAWIADPANKERLLCAVNGLLDCQELSSVAKMLGWVVSAFYTQLFRHNYRQFPLLHVAGPAGTGKTKMIEHLLRLFFYNSLPDLHSASGSTIFSISSLLNASASIPVILDEYKPHTMAQTKLEDLRSLLRSSYSGQTITRGGGNRSTVSFRGISTIRLSAPVVFIAEAIETETAILHRSVVVGLKRPPGFLGRKYLPGWEKFSANSEVLAILGQVLASELVAAYTLERHKEEFDVFWQAAKAKYMVSSEADSTQELIAKSGINDRVVFNYAVVEYGVHKFATLLGSLLSKEDMADLIPKFEELKENVYADISRVVVHSMPEYLKVLLSMSDMSRFPANHECKLQNRMDYEVTEVNGKSAINLCVRHAYYKYRIHQKSGNIAALYQNDASFAQALVDCPAFIAHGEGTAQMPAQSIYLDYDMLQSSGVYAFASR